jgi:hypothetical protein
MLSLSKCALGLGALFLVGVSLDCGGSAVQPGGSDASRADGSSGGGTDGSSGGDTDGSSADSSSGDGAIGSDAASLDGVSSSSGGPDGSGSDSTDSGGFGANCASNADCVGSMYDECRVIAPERQGCTKACQHDSDCPDPPTTGSCSGGGYCI